MGCYATLKAEDPTTLATFVAQTAQAFQWDAEGLGRWCVLIGADPREIAGIIRAAQIAAGQIAP